MNSRSFCNRFRPFRAGFGFAVVFVTTARNRMTHIRETVQAKISWLQKHAERFGYKNTWLQKEREKERWLQKEG